MLEKLFSNTSSLTILLIFTIPIVAVIGYYWHEVMKNRSDNELKRSMIERGMSAEEIERVIKAGKEQPDYDKDKE